MEKRFSSLAESSSQTVCEQKEKQTVHIQAFFVSCKNQIFDLHANYFFFNCYIFLRRADEYIHLCPYLIYILFNIKHFPIFPAYPIKHIAAHKVSISFFFLLIPGNAWLDSLLFEFSINFLIISILYLFTSLFRINEQNQTTRCTNKLVIQANPKYSFNRRVPNSNPFPFFLIVITNNKSILIHISISN